MKQDDYFLKQIDILGRILGKIVADLLKLKAKGDVVEGIDVVVQALKNQLDLDFEEVLQLNESDLIPFLMKKHKFKLEHLELLVEIFMGLSQNVTPEKAEVYSVKSLILLEYVQKQSTTFSIERTKRIEVLKNELFG